MENKDLNVYIVLNEGKVVFTSDSKEKAYDYAEGKNNEGIDDVLEEWGRDDPDEKDINEAAFQAGFDGNYNEVIKVDITDLSEDEQVELPDGSMEDVSDILK